MNRFDIIFPSLEIPALAALEAGSNSRGSVPVITALPLDAPAPTPPAELITRRTLPGTSIRRVRHHRSKWPRRPS